MHRRINLEHWSREQLEREAWKHTQRDYRGKTDGHKGVMIRTELGAAGIKFLFKFSRRELEAYLNARPKWAPAVSDLNIDQPFHAWLDDAVYCVLRNHYLNYRRRLGQGRADEPRLTPAVVRDELTQVGHAPERWHDLEDRRRYRLVANSLERLERRGAARATTGESPETGREARLWEPSRW